MTRLILIRHAKSGWDDPFADDHARVLTKRGNAASTAIGDWLQTNGYLPDVMLVSDAARTQQTATLIAAQLAAKPPVVLMGQLYHAAPDTVLEAARARPEACVAVIAHNPGIGLLAHHLAAKRPAHHRFDDYPTCATTVLDFSGPIIAGGGQVTDFIVPRDLIGTSSQDID